MDALKSRFALGTKSALKVRAATAALEAYKSFIPGDGYTLEPVEIESVVRAQPFGWDEMKRGAYHRAWTACRQLRTDYGIGIESGLVEVNRKWFDVPAVIVVDSVGAYGEAYGMLFPIPRHIVLRCANLRLELGPIIQKMSGGGEKDPSNFYSRGVVPREEQIRSGLTAALAEVFHKDRFAMQH